MLPKCIDPKTASLVEMNIEIIRSTFFSLSAPPQIYDTRALALIVLSSDHKVWFIDQFST